MRAFRQIAVCVLIWGALAVPAHAGSITLAWDPPTDSVTVGYLVRYGTTSGNYLRTIDVGAVTSFRVDGLTDGATYFFAVQGYNSRRDRGPLSLEVSGRVGVGSGPASGPSASPTNIVAYVRDGRFLELSWVPLSGVTAYRVEVGTAAAQTSYSAVTESTTIAFDFSNLRSTGYFARVRGIFNGVPGPPSNEEAINGDVVQRFDAITEAARDCVDGPGPPRRFESAANGNAVQLTWQPGTGITSGYVLQVGSSPGLQNLMLANFPGTQNGLGATAPNGVYALRLAATNACGTSTWGAESLLTVGAAASPIQGSTPNMPASLAQQVTGTTVSLSWTPPVAGPVPTRYLIEAVTPFGPFAYDTASPATSFTNVNTPPGEYEVTVRAGNAAGFGPPSAPVTVVVR